LALFFLGTGIIKAQISTILTFNGTNGQDPYGSVILSGHVLYGMTESGGVNNRGCIFSVHTDGSGYKDLWDFNDTGSHVGNSNGYQPYGSLLILGNKLYGMTAFGGANAYGLIFSVDTDGSVYKDLWDFNHTDGATPWGALISSGTQLFGMTRNGGPDNYGVVFSIDTNGSAFKTLIGFTGVQGINPYGSLTRIGKKLYGMTIGGGAYVLGNIFSIDTNGSAFTDLYDFGSVVGTGRDPYGSLTLVGKKLYGMTYEGGVNNDGLIFSLDTAVGGAFTDLLDFNNASSPEGRYANGDLTSSGSLLYGMTTDGGADGYGLIFSVDTDGSSYNDLVDFNGTNGSLPYGDIVVSGNILYGMTENSGAPYFKGLVFGFDPAPSVTITDTNVSCHGGNNGNATAIVSGGTTPYTYLWNDASSQTTAMATGLLARTYTVYVHDANNNKDTAFVSVTQPTAVVVTADSTMDNGSNNGSVTVNVSGGVSPYTYSWSPVSGTTNSISGLSAGSYCCVISDVNECGQTVCVTVTSDAGIDNINNTSNVNIYPNPTSGNFMITGVSDGQVIELYNYLGQQLNTTIADKTTIHFDVSQRASGIYLIRILNTNGKVVTETKMIKTQL